MYLIELYGEKSLCDILGCYIWKIKMISYSHNEATYHSNEKES